MERLELSSRHVELREISAMFNKNAKAPKGMLLEVGEHQGRFYQLDHFGNRITRLTKGAYDHLYKAWSADTALFARAES